jgi:uncharacterized protein
VLIYIHGFNSSPLSFKAGLLRKRMAALRQDFACPELPHRPREAIALLDGLLQQQGAANVALVGSSLGGYYATWLSERHGIPAVLVNPAVRPYELLATSIGRQTNLYTGFEYEFTLQHVAELQELEVAEITPERYLLLVATGDEVLNYRHALERYCGCDKVVIEGSDHGLSEFALYIDRVLAFCGLAEASS